VSHPSGAPTPIRVLLLEDDGTDAELIVQTLAAAGLPIHTDLAGARAEFMERVASGTHDLILCDFGLRGWNGLEALRWTRASGYRTPFIYVSGTIGEALAVECMKEGATDYVLKSNLERLPHAIHRALNEERLRSDRDRALAQLGDSEQRFGTAFRASPEGITISSLVDGTYIEANDAFLRMTEYERSEVIGRTSRELGIWEDPEARTSLLATLDGAEPVRGHEARFRTRSGKVRQVELSAERIQLQATPCLLAITRDVTELRSLQQQLRQAQKMEAIGRLAGGVAHDFNNLLSVITGYGEMVRQRLAAQDPLQAKVEQILKAADRAAALTRQLLAFSRQQVLQPKILDLNVVVSDMDKMLRPLIGEDVELVMVLDPDLGSVRADPGQLAQIVMNLAVNARDAMPRGGRLTIETSNADLDPAYAAVHPPARAGRYVMLTIGDTGSGIDAETQSHIFEPFFTTKPVGQGTGLGLSTVYGIVKQSDGCIWVYSELGVGTTFKIYLPRLEAPGTEVSEERSAPARRGSETVLLVEDEETLRGLLRETLEGNGYAVLAARDGAEALQVADEHAGPIHLIVTDLVMPGMTGRRVAETIALARPEMKVLCISGYSQEAVARLGVLGRSSGFLGKPFTPEGLLRRVRQLLDDNRSPS
jgi:two-component system, cell cycle sensor histidine kinase and response regulator CckA